ncbi:MAG TPA: hypothetical protein VN976_22115 [Verrucomicrobiae bacterium]|nr:hypothetical protein [Verrucomicrobiae bacterium]
MKGNRVPLSELVGADVRGRRAITMAPEHYYLFPKGVPIRELLRVEKRVTRTATWFYVYWKPGGHGDPGYTGYRDDGPQVRQRRITVEFVDRLPDLTEEQAHRWESLFSIALGDGITEAEADAEAYRGLLEDWPELEGKRP